MPSLNADGAMTVRAASGLLFARYLSILKKASEGKEAPSASPETSCGNLVWMCETAIAEIGSYPVDKISRWLGFVQGVMAVKGLISVPEERDFSRPLFHAAYAAEGSMIPPTRNRPR